MVNQELHNLFFVDPVVAKITDGPMKSRVSWRVVCVHFDTVIDKDLTNLLAPPGLPSWDNFHHGHLFFWHPLRAWWDI